MEGRIVRGPFVDEDGVTFVVVVDGRDFRVSTRQYGMFHYREAERGGREAHKLVLDYVDKHPDEVERLREDWQRSYGGG